MNLEDLERPIQHLHHEHDMAKEEALELARSTRLARTGKSWTTAGPRSRGPSYTITYCPIC